MSDHKPIQGACGECAYWDKTEDRSNEGYQNEGLCRRHPPVAIPSKDVQYDGTQLGGVYGLLAAWPRTFAETDWCGEWLCRNDLAGRPTEKEHDDQGAKELS